MIEKVLNWLDSQIGNTAKDYGFSTDWCALFVNMVLEEHGYTELTGACTYSCTAQMNYFKSKGIFNNGLPLSSEPCIIYYDWDISGDSDHVGIMIYKTNEGLITIEGNTMGDMWCNTNVSKMYRSIYTTTPLVRGYVKLTDIFNESFSKTLGSTVYYGKNYVCRDNTGKCVLIQHMLNVTNNAGLTEDGIIGDNTVAAIKEFQTKYHLEIDGIVGDETLFKLVQLYFNIPLDNFKIGS